MLQGDSVRARYERESSTSDSVFSPDRRKSSASSKSLDEDVAMLTGQEYSDTPRSLSDSSAPWTESSGTTLDAADRPRYGGINRSPTNRSAPDSFDKPGKHTSKSPLSENVEHIKQISLSSPSEFQFKKYHQHAGAVGFPGAPGNFDPQRLPPMFEMVSPHKMAEFVVPNISGDESSVSANYRLKSNSDSEVKSAGGVLTSPGVEEDRCDRSPVNLVGSGNIPHGKNIASGDVSPLSSGSESVFSHYPVYKVPFTSYGARPKPSATSASEDGNVGLVYRSGYEGEESDVKYKSPYMPPEMSPTLSQAEQYSSLTEDREYQSEMGEIYRLPKKMESKLYHQRHGGIVRKQVRGSTERRVSDTVLSFEASSMSTFVQMKEKEQSLGEPGKIPQELLGPADISSLYQSSLGLVSPLQRQFVQPGRPYHQRERSQSLSEFHTMASHELSHHPGRARFPSSSFAENLDAPLVIDDDSKNDIENREGLDLSNKKRKMSVDDVYSPTSDEQADGATGTGASVSTNQGEEGEYERMAQSQIQGGATGTSRDEPGSSTKKYGKGNFIKVATGYQCRICCRVIRHMNNTTAHMRIHANVKPYKCQVCNQQFKYEVDRRYHFSKNHVDLFSKMYFPDEKKSG